MDGGGGKNYTALLGPSTHPWDKSSRDGEEFDGHGCLSGGGHCWAMGFALSFHVIPFSTFHLLGTEQKQRAGTFQKGDGSVSVH